MNDDDDEGRIDLETVDEEIEAKIGSALDFNARMAKLARSKANKFFEIADSMEQMACEYRRIASLHILAAREHAKMLADTIDAEYNVEETQLGGGDEDEGDESEYFV